MVSLIPVIEMEPGAFARVDRPWPAVPRSENPEAWDRQWRLSLGDAGIADVDPIAPGSWFVPVVQLTSSATLRELVDVELASAEDFELDGLGILAGGVALSVGDLLLEPGCCGDLSNLDDWRRAAGHQSEGWSKVWIGHPWTFVSATGDQLTLLETSEGEIPELIPVAGTIARGDLLRAIDRANRECAAFEERLRPCVEARLPGLDARAILDSWLRGCADRFD